MTFAKTIDIIFSSVAVRQVMLKMVNDLKQMIVQYVTQRQVDRIQREMEEQLTKLMEGQNFEIPEDGEHAQEGAQKPEHKEEQAKHLEGRMLGRRALRRNVEGL